MSFINMCYTILSKKRLKMPKGVLRSHKSKDGQHNSQRKKQRLIGSYTSPYWRSGISSTSVRNSIFSRVERNGTSGRNPRSSIRTSASTYFFHFNLKTKHVDFIHSFACQCHVYYTKYYNATCNAVNTHLFKTTLNLLGEIS